MKNIIENLKKSITEKKEVQPILFVSPSEIATNIKIEEITNELISEFKVPKQYIYTLEDSWESLKISEIKDFIKTSFIKPSFPFQIFIIKNISRMTLQSANACLKFFEEPGVWNIVFLTNSWESNILETIISRVNIHHISGVNTKKDLSEISQKIKLFIKHKDLDFINHIFTQKLEKLDYLDIMQAFLEVTKSTPEYFYLLEDINSWITNITKNAQAKYEIDKILLKIITHEQK